MQVVIDANVIFSALYKPDSVPGRLVFLAAADRLLLYAPDTVREEIERAVAINLGRTPAETARLVDGVPVTWIPRAEYAPFLPDAAASVRDEDASAIVAVALLVGAGIISGDEDLHAMDPPLVRSWRPRALLDHLEARGDDSGRNE